MDSNVEESNKSDDARDSIDEIMVKEFTMVRSELAQVIEVPMPPPRNLSDRFLEKGKEFLCSDDPFREFKQHQPLSRKCYLGLKYLIPLLEWSQQYSASYLKSDLIAGITIASLAVPQGIGFAKVAGLPPIIGLYSSFLPPLLYGFFGSSKHVAVGPGSILSILIGSLLREEIGPAEPPETYVKLAFTATFFSGLFQIGMGTLRLGFMVDFMSQATSIGFISGAAVVVCLQQLKGMLGITNIVEKTDVVSIMHAVWAHPHTWNWRTSVIGTCFLVFLIGADTMSKRTKALWITGIAQLVSIIVATLCVQVTHAYHHIGIIGTLQRGLNPISIKYFDFYGSHVLKAMKMGLILAIINVMETIAVGRTFGAKKKYMIDGNKEILALGIVNLTSACFSCYVSSGAITRSAINFHVGCKSALSNIITALLVMMILLAFTPLFYYTPNVILSTIVFVSVMTLIDVKGAYLTWKVDKLDFLTCFVSFFTCIFISMSVGLLVGVFISIMKILLQVARPHITLLGKITKSNIYQDIQHYQDAVPIVGIMIIRIDVIICFLNANYIKQRILRRVYENGDDLEGYNTLNATQYVIVDLTSVMDIDTTGINELTDIMMILREKGIQFVLVGPGIDVMEKLNSANFIQALGKHLLFSSTSEAVKVCYKITKIHKCMTNESKEIS